MIKKIATLLALSLILPVRPVLARYEMKAPTEQMQLLGQYAKQITSTSLYVSTIEEGLAYIVSSGALDQNAVMKFLAGNAGFLGDFQDKLHFSDASSFSSLLGENVGDLGASLGGKLGGLGGKLDGLGDQLGGLGDKALGYARDAGMNDWADGVGASLNELGGYAQNAQQTLSGYAQNAQQTISGYAQNAQQTFNNYAQSAQQTINGYVQNAQQSIGEYTQAAQQKIGEYAQGAKDALGNAVGTVKDTAGNIVDGVKESVSDSFYNKDKSDSSLERVVEVKSNFGEPQASKEAAQIFIRSRYFYSTKDGDKYEGKPLINTSDAEVRVGKNRRGYLKEIAATSLGIAFENLTQAKEDSITRLKALQDQANAAESMDDKKAVEVSMVQERIRQRILGLNIEITALELEVVDEMQTLERKYIIPRTMEQITADTKAELGEKEPEAGEKK